MRIWLIHEYPVIFGDDTVTRLAHHDILVVAYQLPVLQAGIHLLGGDPLLVRYGMALIGAIAGLGFYYLAADLLGSEGALPAALLFVFHPFILAQSIVPYQEILMLGALAFAFHFFFQERWVLAGALLGLACLTRYEAWAACPVLALSYWRGRGWKPLDAARALALFGWAPLAWIFYNGSLSPEGTYVVESQLSLERFFRWVYLGWITVKQTPVPVLLLAGLGAWRLFRQRLLQGPRWAVLAGFFVVFLVAILFSAHGLGERPERVVAAREAHLPIAAAICLAGLGLARFPRYRGWLVAASVLLGLLGARRYIAEETSRPATQLAYRLALYLDRTLKDGERAVILTKPNPPERLKTFLDRAERRGGLAARQRAQQVLHQVGSTTHDYQRTVVHSRLGKSRLLAQPDPPGAPVKWLVVWSDFEPAGAGLAAGALVETIRAGPLSAAVYRLEI